jgi:hypothetical protein
MIEPMEPNEAAEKILGWTGKWRGKQLMRLVFRKEKAEKREIALRFKGEQRTRYKLTEPMLQLHFPEFFVPRVDALAEELSKRIDELRATVGATVDERMAPQIQKIRFDHSKLETAVCRLASTTNEGFGRIERRLVKLENKRTENKDT